MKRPSAKAVFALTATALLAACGAPGIPLPPSLELAKPVADLRAVRKGDRVYLQWTVPTETTNRTAIRYYGPTDICRSVGKEVTTCGTPVGEVTPPAGLPRAARASSGRSKRKKTSSATKVTANYVDTLPGSAFSSPVGEIAYAVEVLNQDRRSAGLSIQVGVPSAPTLPPPSGFKASLNRDGIWLSWDAVSPPSSLPGLQFRYRVYRRDQGGTTDTLVGELPLQASLLPQLLDRNFEWEKAYEYRANVVTVMTQPDQPEIEVEGADTPSVKVLAHDVFPPAVPEGLQAGFSGVVQPPFIDLIWSPDIDADLAGYNVYRGEEGERPVKLNAELLKTPSYRDTNLQPGKKYFYSVSAVDVRGNESARSEPASERVP
jgi:hypothetical protein